jgi:hypothetical protein
VTGGKCSDRGIPRCFDLTEVDDLEGWDEEFPSRRLRFLRKQKRIRILGSILGQLVESRLKVRFYTDLTFFERVQNAHEDTPRIGPCIRD